MTAFIRCARATQWLAHQIFIILSCCYDDFVNVSPEESAKGSEDAFAMLLDLLGWRFDRDGSTADSISNLVTSLGVEFDLRESSKGIIVVSNTSSRRSEILASIDGVVREGRLSKQDTARLKGRVTFAEGQPFGRAARSFFNSLTHHLFHCQADGTLNEECIPRLALFQGRV